MDIDIEKTQSELTSELEFILGRPNFWCGRISRRLREKGFTCKTKAEAEQALVIHVMLKFYNEYEEKWVKEFEKYLDK